MTLLQHLVSTRLPVVLTSRAEVEEVKILRSAGSVIALTPEATDPLTLSGIGPAAHVLAVTQKGWEELGKFSYPSSSGLPRRRPPWSQLPSKLIDAIGFGDVRQGVAPAN